MHRGPKRFDCNLVSYDVQNNVLKTILISNFDNKLEQEQPYRIQSRINIINNDLEIFQTQQKNWIRNN